MSKAQLMAVAAKKPEHVRKVLLQPGDFYFGDANSRIRTLLGSCVSITMWHPARLIGGMCHYMLPIHKNRKTSQPDGKYADDAMMMFLLKIYLCGTQPEEYEVKIFGGGSMFPHILKKHGCVDIASQNIDAARTLTAKLGFKVAAEDLGLSGHRQVIFDIWSGNVWVRKPSIKTHGQLSLVTAGSRHFFGSHRTP